MNLELEKKVVLGEPFSYTKEDIVEGLAYTRETLRQYRIMQELQPDDKYVNGVVTRYTAVVAYAEANPPESILKTVQSLYSEVEAFEQKGTDSVEIGRIINGKYPGLTPLLRGLLHWGWIEVLFQKTYAAGLQSH